MASAGLVGALALAATVAWTPIEGASALADEGDGAARSDKAEERARRAAERDYQAAVRKARMGRAGEALALFEAALPYKNTTSDIFYNLVMVGEATKEWEKVLQYAQGFLFLESDTEDAREIRRKLELATSRLASDGKAPIKYVFDLSPEGWEVFVDHVPLSRNRVTEVLLMPGTHSARATKPDHHPWTQELTISAGDPPQVVTGTLKPEIFMGALKIETEPAEGVDVYVDDKLVGTTPLAEPLALETRRFLVRLEGAGYDRWVRYVQIQRDETYELSATLEKSTK